MTEGARSKGRSMANEKQGKTAETEEPAEDAAEDFVAPERGSAEELLDAEAGDPLDPMRRLMNGVLGRISAEATGATESSGS